MSIEDPRLSSIDNTSAANDFDSAVEQHLGFASETVEGIEVAQAETPDAGRTDRLPAQTPPVQTAAAAIPTEVTPNAENVVTLPAGIELDNLEFQVDGANLVLVLADGTEIVVVGGAANIPTFVIGDVELPQVALFAALEGSNINVAAGPDGTFSAQSTPEASRNFQDDPIEAGPEDFALADLLGDTSFGDELRTGTILGDDGEPTILSPLTTSFIYDEAVITPEILNDRIITGRLPFEPGPDFGTISAVAFTGAINVAEEGGISTALSAFTSGGLPITVTSFPAPTDGADLDFVAIEGRDSAGVLVFTLTITDRTTGDFTFELIGKLEHPDVGQSDLSDLLRLGFTYTVTDLDGDSVTGSFNIDIQDDAPTIGTPVGGNIDEAGVDFNEGPGPEKLVAVLADGPVGPESPEPQLKPVVANSLGIRWGADDDFKNEDVEDDNLSDDDPVGRTVSFTGLTQNSTSEQIIAAIPVLNGLRSDGIDLRFEIRLTYNTQGNWNGGYELVAFKDYGYEGGGEEPGPQEARFYEGDYTSDVFIITLDPTTTNGTYTFQLIGNLDHYQPGSTTGGSSGGLETFIVSEGEIKIGNPVDELDFNIPFTATDSDGDSVNGSFSVVVKDDKPVLNGTQIFLTVDEGDIRTDLSSGSSPNDLDGDGSTTGGFWNDYEGGSGPATVSGYLSDVVDFGADNQWHSARFSLINTTDALKTLTDLGLTSKNEIISFEIVGNTLYGYVNAEGSPQAYGSGDRLVMRLDVYNYGGFDFRLFDQIDHDGQEAASDKNFGLQGSDKTAIDFGGIIQAADFDQDSIPLTGQVVITIRDDVPVLVKDQTEFRTIDEDDISTIGAGIEGESLGTSPNDKDGDGSFTGNPSNNEAGPAFISGTLTNLVKSGADDALTFSFVDAATVRGGLEALGLTSKGEALSYEIKNGILYAFDSAGSGADGVYDGADRLVFQLTLNSNGTYEFRLFDQLDHKAPGEGGADENFDLRNGLEDGELTSLKFGDYIKATDNDGDSIVLKDVFAIRVRDDVPELSGTKENRLVDEDDIKNGQSVGTSPNDGNADGSYTGDPANGADGPAFISGSLANLIKGGADDTVKFSFIDENTARAALETLGLKSQGAELSYDIKDGVLYAFDNAGPQKDQSFDDGDRLVFKLTLSENGSYTFELVDQLDHDRPNSGADQNIDLQDALKNADVEAIDFGSIIKATDFDGDSVVLKNAFSITVRDDVPVLSGAKEERLVDEDDILNNQSVGTSPADGDSDGSYTGGPGQGGKGAAFIEGSLATLVKGGADDPIKFAFIDEKAARSALDKLGLSSKGAELSYDIRGNVLYAFDNDGPNKGESFGDKDRLVFKLTLQENGSYTFELVDQLDHDQPKFGADENTDLQDGLKSGDVEAIDFGSIIKVTDNDGDSIVLKNAFTITIKDDVPTLSGLKEQRIVDEDDIDTKQSTGSKPNDGDSDGSFTGGPGQNGAGPAYINGSLATLIKGGADDTVKFSFAASAAADMKLLGLKSDGATLSFEVKGNVLYGFENKVGNPGYGEGDRVVFKLTLNSNGSYSFELVDQLDHVKPAEGADENFSLQPANSEIDFGSVIKVTDYDGDSISLKGAFTIQVRDDVPVAKNVDAAKILDDEAQTLFKGNDGSALKNDATDVSPNEKSVFGNPGTLFTPGADGVKSVSIVGPIFSVIFMDKDGFAGQEEVKWDQGKPGEGGYTIFTATSVHYPGGAAVLRIGPDGSYSFSMKAPIAHPAMEDAPASGDEEEATLKFDFTVVDRDGDSATGSLTIKVDDDTPEAQNNPVFSEVLDDEAQVTFEPVNKGGVDDVSEDIKEVSGKPGTLFKMGADGLSELSVELPFFAVIAKATSGFAAIELTQWDEGARSGDGTTTFTASSDSYPNAAILIIRADGSYEFKLNAPIAHTASGTGEDNSDLVFSYVATDGDGDVVSGDLVVSVNDDTPLAVSAQQSSVTLDDEAQTLFEGNDTPDDEVANIAVATGDKGALFTAGADGVQSVAVLEGAFQVIYKDGGLALQEGVEWDEGTPSDGGVTTFIATGEKSGNEAAVLKIYADGSYHFELKAPLVHSSEGEDGKSIGIRFEVTDGDGDKASGQLFINVNDDTPVANIEVGASVTLDDDAQKPVSGGEDDEDYDYEESDDYEDYDRPAFASAEPNLAVATGEKGALFSAGADGVQSVSINGGAFEVIYQKDGLSLTEAVKWGEGTTSEDGITTFIAKGDMSKNDVAVLKIGSDGSYSFELKAPVVHSDEGEDEKQISIGFQVTDGDGDTAGGQLYISVKDDQPGVNEVEAKMVIDDEGQTLSAGNPGANWLLGWSDAPGENTSVSGGAGSLFNVGADGLKSISLNGPKFEVVALDENGFSQREEITWDTGKPGEDGSIVFTATSLSYPEGAAILRFGSDGSYTFTMLAPLAHPEQNPLLSGIEEDKSLRFGFTVVDGDDDGASGSLTVKVDDDAPQPLIKLVSPASLDDEAQTVFEPNLGGRGDVEADIASVSGGEGALFKIGADGLADISVDLPFLAVIAKAANGLAAIELAMWDEGERSAGGVTTFKAVTESYPDGAAILVIRADGSYDFTLNAPIAHTVSSSREDNAELTFEYVVTDGDGDKAIGALKITVDDDTPKAEIVSGSLKGCEGTLFSAGADGVQSVDIKGQPFQVGYSGKQGTTHEVAQWKSAGELNEDGSTTFKAIGNLSKQVVATITIKADGSYNFELLAPVKDKSAVINFTVTDGDGDTASGKLTVDLVGNVPSRMMSLAGGVVAVDPLVLDLDKNGFELSGIQHAVMFDINADGHKDQMGWTSKDAILALDLDNNGVIDNGSELFTPDFNGGKFASGVEALASLNSNGDGKIDANDDLFSKLSLWIDANNNGVSDAGELSSLSDHHVASISLTTDQSGGLEDGQQIFAEGEFTFDDGSTGQFVEVGFETIFGTDGNDVLHGGMGEVVMTGGAGADTFVFDETALSHLDVADVITDYNSSEGDVLDVSALLDSLLGEQATAETAASHIRATVDDGNTTVSVQTAPDTWKDVVVLQNHDTAIKALFDDKHTVTVNHD